MSLSSPLSRADFTPSWHVPERDENQGNGIHCDPDTASGTEQFIIATTLNSAGKRHIIGYQWETPFCIESNQNLCLDFWILLSIQKKNKIPSIKFTTRQTGDPPRAYPASHTEVAGIVSSPMATLNWISEWRWVSGWSSNFIGLHWNAKIIKESQVDLILLSTVTQTVHYSCFACHASEKVWGNDSFIWGQGLVSLLMVLAVSKLMPVKTSVSMQIKGNCNAWQAI